MINVFTFGSNLIWLFSCPHNYQSPLVSDQKRADVFRKHRYDQWWNSHKTISSKNTSINKTRTIRNSWSWILVEGDRQICGSLKGKRVGYGGSWCHLTPRLTSRRSSFSYNISGDLGFEELVVVLGLLLGF